MLRTCVVTLSLRFLIRENVKQQLLKLNILKSQDYSAYNPEALEVLPEEIYELIVLISSKSWSKRAEECQS